jgi:hypothetical protein
MSNLKVFKMTDVEYSRLKAFAEFAFNYQMEARKADDFFVGVGETYFDYGQDWKYTALITKDEEKEESWQSLCPRDWELVVTETDINKIIAMAWFYMDNLQKPYNERKSLYERF